MNKDIISELMTRSGLSITVTSEDLMIFSEQLIQKAEDRIRKANEAKANERWLSTAEAKVMTGLSVSTLTRYAKRGMLTTRRVGSALLFNYRDLKQILNGNKKPPTESSFSAV